MSPHKTYSTRDFHCTRFELISSPILFSYTMFSDLPTTIFVPTSSLSEVDQAFTAEEESLCSDDDDLSLSREMIRERCRAAPESRRQAPPRTISTSSESRRAPLRTCSTASEPVLRRTPPRTVSNDSIRRASLCRTDFPLRQVSPSPAMSQDASDQTSMRDPLDQMYREGLRKLAASMRHSDMTRNAIKRQCSKYSYRASRGSMTSSALSRQQEFFLSSRCDELEQCRRQMLQIVIHHA